MIREHTNKCWHGNNPRKAIILHTDLGTYKGTYDWIFNGSKSVSYNYYVRKNGEVYEWVPQHKQAWHTGVVYQPTHRAKLIFDGSNPNKMSVGICYEGKGEKANDKQVKAIVNLIKDLGLKDKPIFAHVELTSYKPKVVLDCKERVQKDLNDTCTLSKFTILEMWSEIRRRIYQR